MQRLEVSGAVRPIYGSLGVKRLMVRDTIRFYGEELLQYRPTSELEEHPLSATRHSLFTHPQLPSIFEVVPSTWE